MIATRLDQTFLFVFHRLGGLYPFLFFLTCYLRRVTLSVRAAARNWEKRVVDAYVI